MKYIFITGGVVSGLGKGICAASLARLLKQRGFRVQNQKFDPYLNVDPGTMSPYQHGEVFVTDDGAETDLDLGHYERFTSENLDASNSVSSGKIYWNIIQREREGGYLGRTVQIIPHVTDEIKSFIYTAERKGLDIAICEIGGTVGDIESLPFLEAIRQVGQEKGRENVLYIPGSGELKSKPVQHSVKELQSLGIQPDILVCRCAQELTEGIKNKISSLCNIERRSVIQNLTAPSIYEVPLWLEKEGLVDVVIDKLHLPKTDRNLERWIQLVDRIKNASKEAVIALVGKYTDLHDSYLSVEEALFHAATECDAHCNIRWVDSESVTIDNVAETFAGVDGIIIPGGFGNRGIEGMVETARFAREHNTPLLGICLGMQVLVIEYARNVLGYADANSSEFNPESTHPVIDLMPDQIHQTKKGATMRLGAYPCVIEEDTLAHRLYNKKDISERHRHRYEFNNRYRDDFLKAGLKLCGLSPDGSLVEIVENPQNPYYIAAQFHPEFKSRPLHPHPLFVGLIKASLARK